MITIIVIYLFLIAPDFKKKDTAPFRGRYYAHRGLHDNSSAAPENSLAAFRKAIDADYGMEFDVQLTKDGKAVICHDLSLNRMYRDADGNTVGGLIADHTYEELLHYHILNTKEKMPLLTEVLKMTDGRIPLIIELKTDGRGPVDRLCNTVNGILEDYKGVYCIESFDPRVVMWYRHHRPDIVRGQLSMDYARVDRKKYKCIIYPVLTHLLTGFLGRPDFIAYDHRHKDNLSRSLCFRLFKGLAVAYTLKSQKELDEDRNDFDIFIFDSFIPEDI